MKKGIQYGMAKYAHDTQKSADKLSQANMVIWFPNPSLSVHE